jgi:hypothetical protein
MKYFTPELWASWSASDYKPPPPDQDPFVLYRRELEALRDRFDPEVFHFFGEADVHDGELLEFTVTDGSRSAPLGSPARKWERAPGFPVTVVLRVLDSWDRYVWTLRYSGVRRVETHYAADSKWGGGFDDWGYHELSHVGGDFFRHEVLFATDSILLVEFRQVDVERADARVAQQEAVGGREEGTE